MGLRLVAVFLALLFYFKSFSQDWELFQDKATYNFSELLILSARVDSVENIGSNTVYYFNSILNDSLSHIGSPQYNMVAHYLKPNFFGRQAVVSNDTVCLKSQEGNLIFLLPKGNISQQWILADLDSVLFIAKIDSIYTDSVNGQVDSVKQIIINSVDTNGNYYNHPLNNFKTLITKNNGFLRVFDFYHISYYGTFVGNNFLRPMNRLYFSVYRTRRQIFDYQTGDVFHLSSDEYRNPQLIPYPTDYINSEIINSQLGVNSDTINFSIENKNEINTAFYAGTPPQIFYSQVFSQQTIGYQEFDLDSAFFTVLPGELEVTGTGNNFIKGNYAKVRSNTYNGRLNFAINKYTLVDTLGTWVLDNSEYTEIYIEGVCNFKNRDWVTNGGNVVNQTWKSLQYFKKGAETWGHPVIVTTINEFQSKDSFQLFPNPSSGFVNLKSEIPIAQLKFYDVKGRLLQIIKQPTKQIELPQAKGIYFLRLELENGEILSRKVVRN